MVSAQELLDSPHRSVSPHSPPPVPEFLYLPHRLIPRGPRSSLPGSAAPHPGVLYPTQSNPTSTLLRHLRQSLSVSLTCDAPGRLDCVVCWPEYELCPGVVLSFAPACLSRPATQGRPHASLCPHVWHRVHYMTMRPQLLPGQDVTLDLRLDRDSLRVELDESCLPGCVQPPFSGSAPGDVGAMPCSSPSCSGSSEAGASVHGGGWRDLRDGTWRPLQQREREDAGQQQGLEAYPAGRQDAAAGQGSANTAPATAADEEGALGGDAPASPSSDSGRRSSSSSDGDESEDDAQLDAAMAILPYHMCMLNDRNRNRRYRDGIGGELRITHKLMSSMVWFLHLNMLRLLLLLVSVHASKV